MLLTQFQEFETVFFRGLNQIAEPLIRAGLVNPIFSPAGLIVIEITGRKTGRKSNLPVLATRFGNQLVFSTVRRNSQWVRNLTAQPDVRYWLAGQPREATAFVFTPDQEPHSAKLPPAVNCLAQFLQAQSCLLGISFAILTPRN